MKSLVSYASTGADQEECLVIVVSSVVLTIL